MKMIDAEHALAHLKCVRQIMCENFDSLTDDQRLALIENFKGVEDVIKEASHVEIESAAWSNGHVA